MCRRPDRTHPPGDGPSGPAGTTLLAALRRTTQFCHPELAVEVLLGHGDPAGTLIELSLRAELVVLGTTGVGGNLLSLIGSVSSRVAAQAYCPVVVVPEQPAGPAVDPTIEVGIADTAAGAAALRFAFDEARRRGVSVTAVRAQATGRGTAQPTNAPLPPDEAALPAALVSCRQQYPDVPVRVLLSRTDPAEAVLRASQHAELVVIGAHHSEDRWSSRLGPVPQTVLHHTNCPVVLIGTPHQH
ncbi:MAG: universal stress protein [Jatrophihabitantaceae bacterium]